MEKLSERWEKMATGQVGSEGYPGGGFAIIKLAVYRLTDVNHRTKYEARAIGRWGSNQGRLEVHTAETSRGRGDSPAEAISEIEQDVLDWWPREPHQMRSALRDLRYEAEDYEADNNE